VEISLGTADGAGAEDVDVVTIFLQPVLDLVVQADPGRVGMIGGHLQHLGGRQLARRRENRRVTAIHLDGYALLDDIFDNLPDRRFFPSQPGLIRCQGRRAELNRSPVLLTVGYHRQHQAGQMVRTTVQPVLR